MTQSYPRDSNSQLIPPDLSRMSLPLASSIAASRNTLVPLTLGRSTNAIELLVPTAPAGHNAPDLKARCFAFMSDLLLEHAVQYSSAELIAVCNHIPGSSYNANQEAATICSSIHSAFFTCTDLTDLGFRDHQGHPITTPNWYYLFRLCFNSHPCINRPVQIPSLPPYSPFQLHWYC